MEDNELKEMFGLSAKQIKQLRRNDDMMQRLTAMREPLVGKTLTNGMKALLYALAGVTAVPAIVSPAISYILSGELKRANQIQAISGYISECGETFNKEAFEAQCGIGVTYSEAEIEASIDRSMEVCKDVIEVQKHAALGSILKEVMSTLTWLDGKELKQKVMDRLVKELGPKQELDKKAFRKVRLAAKKKEEKVEVKEDNKDEEVRLAESIKFWSPEENHQPDPQILTAHLQRTGGGVRTRFPPEPNGHLHIGHAMAMNLSFEYAKKKGGLCFLRFDDTNPEAESQEYVDSIIDAVTWLGHSPYKITHSSDYFQTLYEYAIRLIKEGCAFVCHLTAEEMREDREYMRKTHQPKASPYRDRSIEENLQLFEDMKNGKFKSGEATLRMRYDLSSPNPVKWDPVAYRIKDMPHPNTGTAWKIYPSYDFTHCLVDSLEDITHSLCSKEFEIRREAYNWLCETIGVYRPIQWEFSRLNVQYSLTSKRKLLKLIEDGVVRGWDDPRLLTVSGMRRRGYPAEAINNFCRQVGLTQASGRSQPLFVLEDAVRTFLDPIAPRAFAVLKPLLLEITNYPKGEEEMVKGPKHPKDPSMGEREIPFSREVYIEREDFRIEDSKGYYRLAVGKEVRLRYAYVIRCTSYEVDAQGEVVKVFATYDKESTSKPKGVIGWVAKRGNGDAPHEITFNIYSKLFTTRFPAAMEKKVKADGSVELIKRDPLDYVDKQSLKVVKALVEPAVKQYTKPLEERVQFERLGYACIDPDSVPDKPIWNMIVPLKADKMKDADIKAMEEEEDNLVLDDGELE